MRTTPEDLPAAALQFRRDLAARERAREVRARWRKQDRFVLWAILVFFGMFTVVLAVREDLKERAPVQQEQPSDPVIDYMLWNLITRGVPF